MSAAIVQASRRRVGVVVTLGVAAALAASACSTPRSSESESAATTESTTEPAAPVVEGTRAGAPLKAPDAFADIGDEAERSRAIFAEVGQVFTHPRCVNCHPAGDRPLQGEGLPHQPLAFRNDDGRGAPGMECTTCHGPDNYLFLPGDPDWHLAPRETAWEGKSVAAICAQVRDPERNGGLDLDGLVEHVATDSLVGYGWRPPAHLEPAPGTQAEAAALLRAWVDTGAHCPSD